MKKGFTLAEILITVAVIGVVAALTIPAVAKKVQDNQLKTAFKKTYSNLTNAYAKTIADLGYTPECYYTTPYASSGYVTNECSLFWAELKKNLRIIKECNGNAFANGCVPKYSKYGSSSGCNDMTENSINNLRTVWVMADGTILIRSASIITMFDTNGRKAPNKPGYDLFWLGVFTPEGKKPIMIIPTKEPGCFTPEAGGKTSFQMLQYSFQ